jgi:aminoacyl tRNA synthase complex-interacting multifunctional protein 1
MLACCSSSKAKLRETKPSSIVSHHDRSAEPHTHTKSFIGITQAHKLYYLAANTMIPPTTTISALELIDDAIAELEARLGLSVSTREEVPLSESAPVKQHKKRAPKSSLPSDATATTSTIPVICQLEFKVGVITKVWIHEAADTLYCEEIDVGETEPRQIASGLRPHFSLEQMMGQRLLVVTNLKAKNLVGFKSHGMVLCAAKTLDGAERVEFVEPPADASIGEVISFQDLPAPEPISAAQVEKRKVFAAASEKMMTNESKIAVWDGHAFMTSAGPCTTKTIAGGVLR